MILYTFFIFVALNLFFLILCKKYYLLADQKVDFHKKLTSDKTSYLVGGCIILIYFFYFYYRENNFIYFFFLATFFFIGLLSDARALNNPVKRLFLQITALVIFVIILDLKIIDTRINLFNIFLLNPFFNKFLVIFCLMVLINGSNFLDGINTLLLNYFFCIFIIIVIFFPNYVYDENLIKNLSIVLLSIIIFNFFGYIFLGDSGSYLLSLFTGIFLIKLAQYDPIISPYFVILLLWYPCFELLYSIIRRVLEKKESFNPDNRHLHQLFFIFGIQNYKINKLYVHAIISLIINTYNFIIFYISARFYNYTVLLILIIFFNIVNYIILYQFLKKKLKIK